MAFIGEDGKEHRPFMVHQALMGSLERFFGILIEHYNGNFPLWLAPIQVEVIPIAERHNPYAESSSPRSRPGVFGPGPTCGGRSSATRSARPRRTRSPFS